VLENARQILLSNFIIDWNRCLKMICMILLVKNDVNFAVETE
jgi:hypothetical protein